MKKLTLTLALMLSLTLGAMAQYSLSLTTNERGEWSPVAVYEVGKLTNVLGTKQELRLLGFAGMNAKTERPILAGAVTYRLKVAKELSFDLGPAVRYEGRAPRIGAFFGISYTP